MSFTVIRKTFKVTDKATKILKKYSMRSTYAIIFLMFFAACSPSVTSPTGLGGTYIKYKINGEPVEIKGGFSTYPSTFQGVYAAKQIKSPGLGLPDTRYVISGALGVNKQITLSIVTDSLRPQTYAVTGGASLSYFSFVKQDSAEYANMRTGDVLTINVSKYGGGFMDGTFNGKISWPKGNGNALTYIEGVVTEGEFKNVQIIY